MARQSIARTTVNAILNMRKEAFPLFYISKLTGVSLRSVSRILQSGGMVKHHPDVMLHGNASNAIAAKLREGRTVSNLAAEYRVSTDTVERIASLNGIVTRVPKRQKIAKFKSHIHTKLMMARGKYEA